MKNELNGWEGSPVAFKNFAERFGVNLHAIGVGMRVTMQIKSHPKRLTNKKWKKRFGVVSWTIPADVIDGGKKGVRNHMRDVLRWARSPERKNDKILAEYKPKE